LGPCAVSVPSATDPSLLSFVTAQGSSARADCLLPRDLTEEKEKNSKVGSLRLGIAAAYSLQIDRLSSRRSLDPSLSPLPDVDS